MPSRFETRFAAAAIPQLQRQFAFDIDFILDDDHELRFTAFVDIDPISQVEQGFIEVDGRLTIKTADLLARSFEFTALTKVRIREEIFDVYCQAPDHAGLTVFNIRRKYDEQKQSNLYDLNRDQLPYAN